MSDDEAIVVARRGADDAADRRLIVVLDAAAERVGQQLLGERRDEAIGSEQRLPQPVRTVELRAVGHRSRRVDWTRRTRRASAIGRPVEVLERQARADPSSRGSSRTAGCADARPSARASERTFVAKLVGLSAGTFGGGDGGGVPSRFSRIHLPRTTGDVRSGYDVTVRMLP